MIILRKTPYPLALEYILPDPSTSYWVVIWDKDRADIEYEVLVVTDSEGEISADLPEKFSRYDETYSVEIYEQDLEATDLRGDLVLEDNLTIERPYVDPATLVTADCSLETAIYNERLARAIVDSITDGFYFRTKWLEIVGQGTDYMPMWDRVYKILKVYENSELVYDSSLANPVIKEWNYLLTKDRTAITKDPIYANIDFNRAESTPVGLSLASSDSFSIFDTADSGNTLAVKPGVLFYFGTDYIFYLETGYKVVPFDIQDAMKMLINDIACGKLEYFKRYVTEYSTDQFKIKMDKTVLDGTGNILVDKILEKYENSIKRPGIL